MVRLPQFDRIDETFPRVFALNHPFLDQLKMQTSETIAIGVINLTFGVFDNAPDFCEIAVPFRRLEFHLVLKHAALVKCYGRVCVLLICIQA
jgi:hypothetical protein